MALKLGEMLIREGLLTSAQLEEALKYQVIFGGKLGTNLIEMGLVEENALARVLSRKLGVPCAEESELMRISPEVIKLIPKDIAARYKVIPLRLENRRLTLVMADPTDLKAIDENRLPDRLSGPAGPDSGGAPHPGSGKILRHRKRHPLYQRGKKIFGQPCPPASPPPSPTDTGKGGTLPCPTHACPADLRDPASSPAGCGAGGDAEGHAFSLTGPRSETGAPGQARPPASSAGPGCAGVPCGGIPRPVPRRG